MAGLDSAVAALLLIRAWLPVEAAHDGTAEKLRALIVERGCEHPVVFMRSMTRGRHVEIEASCEPVLRREPPKEPPS